MNSKVESRFYNNGSPNMFGAGRTMRVTGATYYNSNRKPGSPNNERVRRKTESEPMVIPTSRQNSPRGGSPRGVLPFYCRVNFRIF
jgi:hypothetical protein